LLLIASNHNPYITALDMFPDGTIVSAAETTVKLWYSDKRKEQMACRFAILNNQMIFPDDASVAV
jgi:hypothetical protein